MTSGLLTSNVSHFFLTSLNEMDASNRRYVTLNVCAVYFLTAFFLQWFDRPISGTDILQEMLENDKDTTWIPAEAYGLAFKSHS